MNLHFETLFHHVVEDEEAEHDFGRHERVVSHARVLQQLDRGELHPGLNAACGWKLEVNSENVNIVNWKSFVPKFCTETPVKLCLITSFSL